MVYMYLLVGTLSSYKASFHAENLLGCRWLQLVGQDEKYEFKVEWDTVGKFLPFHIVSEAMLYVRHHFSYWGS
jgi:hypothetical protein